MNITIEAEGPIGCGKSKLLDRIREFLQDDPGFRLSSIHTNTHILKAEFDDFRDKLDDLDMRLKDLNERRAQLGLKPLVA